MRMNIGAEVRYMDDPFWLDEWIAYDVGDVYCILLLKVSFKYPFRKNEPVL